jgi:lysophospholipase L1-like esterase
MPSIPLATKEQLTALGSVRVPYTGATGNVDIGEHDMTAQKYISKYQKLFAQYVTNTTDEILTHKNVDPSAVHTIFELRSPDTATAESTLSLHNVVEGLDEWVRDVSMNNYSGSTKASDVLSHFTGTDAGQWLWVTRYTDGTDYSMVERSIMVLDGDTGYLLVGEPLETEEADPQARLDIRQHGYLGKPALMITMDSSHEDAPPAIYCKNDSNYAMSGALVKFSLVNSTDTATVLKLENEGTGNSIEAPNFAVAKNGEITSPTITTLNSDDSTEGSVLKSIKDNAEDATFTPTEASGIESETIKEAVNEVGVDVENNKEVIQTGATIFATTINLFDKSLAEDGYYYNTSTGLKVSYANSAITGLIKVKPRKVYTFESNATYPMASYILYDIDGVRITNGGINASTKTINSGWGTYYIGIYFLFGVEHSQAEFESAIDSIIVSEASSITEYVAYNEINTFKLLTGKIWACLGDSITEKNFRSDKLYHSYVSDETGVTVLNYGDSGSGYKKNEGTNIAFYQRAGGISSCDACTIFGSGNDMTLVDSYLGDVTDTTSETICGCINLTIDNFRTYHKLTPLGIIAPAPWETQSPEDPTCRMALYTEKLEAICKLKAVPYLDLYHESNLRPWDATNNAYYFSCEEATSGDGTHPNAYGHALIAKKIKQFLIELVGYSV